MSIGVLSAMGNGQDDQDGEQKRMFPGPSTCAALGISAQDSLAP